MRIGLLGGGTIGRLILQHIRDGALPDMEVAAVAGRSPTSRGRALAESFGVPYTPDPETLADYGPQVIVESASHDAVRDYVEGYLARGIDVIVLSAGALADDGLRERLTAAAEASGAQLWVPSGGIGGLDALKGAVQAGVDSVVIVIRKPPAAWRDIPYVEELGIDLDALRQPVDLYAGPTRRGVALFPQNVNIAAALSLAGIGFDRTEMRVVADPTVTHNTHRIEVSGRTGRFVITLENVPSPDNPKTAWLACYSALGALAQYARPFRVGT